MVIVAVGVIYYLAVGRSKEFAPVVAPAGTTRRWCRGSALTV